LLFRARGKKKRKGSRASNQALSAFRIALALKKKKVENHRRLYPKASRKRKQGPEERRSIGSP